MNLILGSLIAFILVAPGLAFRFSYLHGTYAKQSFKVSAIDEIFWSLIPTFIFQVIGMAIVENHFGFQIRIDFIYYIINGAESTNETPIDFYLIKKSLTLFLFYTLVQVVFASLIGLALRAIVLKIGWDIKYSFLLLNNEWHYLFSGILLDFPDIPGESKSIDFIQIDALINTSQGDVLYSGILENYFLSKDNGLDRIYITNVFRRRLDQDLTGKDPNPGYLKRSSDDRYYSMPGDIFVIPYEKTINVNITYWQLKEVEENSNFQTLG